MTAPGERTVTLTVPQIEYVLWLCGHAAGLPVGRDERAAIRITMKAALKPPAS